MSWTTGRNSSDGDASDPVRRDLGALVTTVGELEPKTEAQRAFVDDAVARLARAAELRATSVRLARDQQLPDVLWIAVLGGSVIVLGLSPDLRRPGPRACGGSCSPG